MQLINAHSALFCALLGAFVCCLNSEELQWYEGDPCYTKHYEGKCIASSQCVGLENTMTRMGLKAKHVGHCGFTVYEEVICCPKLNLPNVEEFARSAFVRGKPPTESQLETFKAVERETDIIIISHTRSIDVYKKSNQII